MSRAQDMGMKRDMQQRKSLARIDDDFRRRKIEAARKLIYDKNLAVDTERVEALLREQSLVPTLVGIYIQNHKLPF